MTDRMEDAFAMALVESMEDHARYGHVDSGDWEENGAMRVVGVARGDTLRLAASLLETYGMDLATGWCCPVCGRLRDEDGDCPEGHEFDRQSVLGGKASVLLSIVEICVSLGVHLERARWTAATGGGDV